MKILLDTCAVIWSVSAPRYLSARARHVLEAEETEVFVSPLSCAEIACAVERRRLKLNQHWKIWFRRYIELNRWIVEDIDLEIVEDAYSLPGAFHDDPVDRIIVATARSRNYSLLTADKKMLSYPHVKSIW